MATTISTTPHHDIEKGSAHHLEHSDSPASPAAVNLRPPIQLTPDQYEQLFLQPGGRAPLGDLSRRFGNPTPLGIISHLISLTPTACYLMGWGSADATSLVSMVGPYYFIGGLGLVISGVMEWILGNSFPSVVFVSFGGFWLSLGALQDPEHNIAGAYPQGAASPAFNDGLMFYFAFWAVTCTVYFVVSLRTNMVFVGIFFTLVGTFIFLSAAYSKLGNADADMATTLLKAAGAFAWVCICFAWYLIVSLLFAVVDMPVRLPLGDLSGFLVRKRS